MFNPFTNVYNSRKMLLAVNWPIQQTQCCTQIYSNPLGIKRLVPSISISFKCELYIIMQMKHRKNPYIERFELGTTWVNRIGLSTQLKFVYCCLVENMAVNPLFLNVPFISQSLRVLWLFGLAVRILKYWPRDLMVCFPAKVPVM